MKRNKKLKKIIMGGVGFAMAVVVFFVGSMQSMQEVAADVRVFDKITEKYPTEGTFKMNILEIVPTGNMVTNNGKQINSAAEMGYFLPLQDRMETPTMTSYGAALATPFSSRDDASYGDALYQMRTYGMIRPSGDDAAGSYPIYALYNGAGIAIFSNYKNATCNNAYSQSFTKGVYSFGTGYYNIADGYTLDDNGTICKKEIVPIVSDNSTLSENNPTYDPVNNTITELVPVTDIDMSSLSLPTSTSGTEYITYAPEGNGTVVFTRSESVTNKTEYYGYTDQVLYYMKDQNTYFYNSSYFREFVLGSKTKYQNKNINYEVKKASDVTVQDITNADLIYISGKDTAFASADISEEVLLAIYNKEVNEHKAVMMDYVSYGKESDTNVSKLAILLWRESQSDIATKYKDYYTTGTTDLSSLEFMKGDALKELKDSMMSGANGNFVTGNTYVYNHHMSDFSDPKSLIDAGDMFANGDFNSAYTASAMQNGFANVLNYITATNKNSTTGAMPPSVTPAVAIQYILISDGNPLSIMKTSLHVLEIQPVSSFKFNEERGSEEFGYLDDDGDAKKNRERFVKQYLGNYYDDKTDYITFTSMTVDEFNGRNEDLIETYDIIYIGSEMGNLYKTGTLRSELVGATALYQDKELPVYRDNRMNGNVYFNIGDELTVDSGRLCGFLDKDTTTARFGARDITKDKLTKLKSYLDSQKLVFVEGDLMAQSGSGIYEVNPTDTGSTNYDQFDQGRIDSSSNLYEFMQYGIGYRFNSESGVYENYSSDGKPYTFHENLVSIADIDNRYVDKTIIEKYITTEKLTLTVMKQPKEYSYLLQANSSVLDPDTVQYMEESASGTRRLEYEFMISSDILDAPETSTYRPYFYVDVNNDGKYSKTTESVRDMQIVIKANGQEAERDADNNYVLYKDVEYKMTRELDESYNGFLQWKLSIQSNLYENSHASAQGSTVVKNKGDNEVIKILQITSPNGSTLNLQAQNADKNSLYGKYLDAVPGYDVEIRTMSLTDFEQDFDLKWYTHRNSTTTGAHKPLEEFAMDYFNSIEIVAPTTDTSNDGVYGANMIVLGFGDNFPSIQSEDAIKALQTYMESEKPVLLAHDFIMYWAKMNNANTDSKHARYLRGHVGMDKYGVTQNITTASSGGITVAELINAARNPDSGAIYLHSGVAYTRSGDESAVRMIESTGKAVAYQPGSTRENVLPYTQGLSNSVLMRFQAANNRNTWLNAAGASTDYYGAGDYKAERMNEGQITSYPYAIPESFKVLGTHGQYFQLDLDADDDDDGESDVVVWYALGNYLGNGHGTYNPWSNSAGGPMPAESYYIYNKGNLTYTGAGHSSMITPDGASDAVKAEYETQAQLFINTLFAAYSATSTEPSVGFFEEIPDADTEPINSITVPYDENVTIDSSVLKDAQGEFRYRFVNPNVDADNIGKGTPVYFRLMDTNFVRGTKYMEIEYFMKADGNVGETFVLDDNTRKTIEPLSDTLPVSVVNISDKMTTYNIANKAFGNVISRDPGTDKVSTLESGVVYGFYLPLSYLNDNSQVTIYIKAQTRIHSVSSQTGQETITNVPGVGISELTVTKADLLDLD